MLNDVAEAYAELFVFVKLNWISWIYVIHYCRLNREIETHGLPATNQDSN